MKFFKTKYGVIKHKINEWYYPQYRYWWCPFWCCYTSDIGSILTIGSIYLYSYKDAEQYIREMQPKKVIL